MTFGAWRALVLENLDVDANRRGTEVLRDRSMQNAMADLQRYIHVLRPLSGKRASFIDTDVLVDGWDEETAECVAEYVKAKLVGRYDKDLQRVAAHMSNYARLRQQVYLELRNAPQDATARETTLQVRQGKSFVFTFEVSRSIAGATIEFCVKPSDSPSIQNDTAPIYISSEVVDSGFVLLDDAGRFSVQGVASINSVPSYRWDIEITYSDGVVETPEGLHGPFVVLADQTTTVEEEE